MVITVIVGVSIALVARTVSNLGSVRRIQSFAAALTTADAGLSDAMFRIDQQSSPASFCVGTSSLCVASSIPGAPGSQYKATLQSDNNTFIIQSVGTQSGILHAVQATVSRTQQFPFAVFGKNALTFNGNNSGIDTYNASGIISPAGPVTVGSDGTISCNGGGGTNVKYVYYTGGGGITGCGTNSQAILSPYKLPLPPLPAAGTYLPCPGAGTFGAAGLTTTLTSGIYLCTSTLILDGTINIISNLAVNGGVVSIYINPGNLQINGGAVVNGPTTSPATWPVASNLRIFMYPVGDMGTVNGGSAYTFGGVVYAPEANLTENGCKSVYYGSLMINTLTCNGGPNLTVHYDARLAALMTAWSTSDYSEIPSGSVSIP
jgi:hypothetical protein